MQDGELTTNLASVNLAIPARSIATAPWSTPLEDHYRELVDRYFLVDREEGGLEF